MVSIREVAKEADVSISTVSRVINNTVPVNEQTRERVIRAMADLNYHVTRPTPKVKPLNIGIIMPKQSASNLPGHPAFYSSTTSFVAELDREGVDNTLVLLDEEHLKNVSSLFANKLDGYFIMGTSEEEEDILLPYIKSMNIPYIILNRWVNEEYTNYVNVNDVIAACEGTKWLIGLGHTKIAFISGNKNFRNSILRLNGYRLAMKEAGISVPDNYIFHGEYTEDFGYSIADAVWQLADRPTAAFFTSDMIAIGFQRRLQELGVDIPSDFAIVGWGNFNISSYVSPALTTVDVPHQEMGAQAAKALLNLIHNSSIARVQILMKASLVIRDSCGAKT